MKSTPILFKPEAIPLVMSGAKPVTRRVINPQPKGWKPVVEADGITWSWCQHGDMDYSKRIRCPYGRSGDKLWVKESWRGWLAGPFPCIEYRHGGDEYGANLPRPGYNADHPAFCSKPKWRGPLFMPKWASRITLEIINVSAERLQDISEKDCEYELGVKPNSLGNAAYGTFRDLWDQINAKRGYPFSDNVWVWRIEIKRINEQW